MTAILNRVRWYLIAILICIFQIISNRASFHVSIGHLYIFLGKMYLGLPLKFMKLEGRYIGEQNEDAVVQLLSHVWLFGAALTVEPQVLSSTISWTLLTLMSIELVMLSYHLILCRALILLPHSFPASGSFPMNELFTSGGQSIGASALAPVLPMNIQARFPLGLIGWVSLLSKGLSRVFSSTTVWKHQSFGAQPSFWFQFEHPYMTTEKTIALARWIFGWQN